ncbi:uncharacterized protein LOC110449846 [Mizuhopecten yessoensis]|uniref:Uncharacterized protein n=1 Tax=Mizuhopecten yessoensis TaxID=6573 RepID=A0A210QQC0_MIZYE|nr:uncharacterized protein LOC110449846 [Mizuhopecten yessoensis]OWF50946.1 hypothetical protein KP79_PYT07470 [Mizuhopecten yessoensis]
MAKPKAQLGLDTEYDALRRRMSRIRVKEGQKPTADDMDVIEEEDDENFKDLIKFWKKHNVGFAKEMMKMVESNKAKKTTKTRGRRKSIEFEDLNQTSSGGLSLPAHLVSKQGKIPEEEKGEESDDVPSIRRPKKMLSQKQRSFTSSRTNSRSNVAAGENGSPRTDGQTKKHVFRRADSENMASKLSSNPKQTRERIASESSSTRTGSAKTVKKK